MKYRIKESEEPITITRHQRRPTGGLEEVITVVVEKRYQIEMRLEGFWGYLWGWSEIGSALDTEVDARKRVAEYKRAEGPRFKRHDKGVRYINID